MNTRFTCQLWQQPNFRAVNKFYRSQKHKGSASGDESIFVIYQDAEINDHCDKASEPLSNEPELVAAVRLVPHDNYYWLRSLYIKQELRGQNLGSELLAFVHQHITLPIYCFPYTHLEQFYGRAGYELVTPEQLPQSLNQLFERYQGKGQSILAMAKL